MSELKQYLTDIPHKPGVYRFFDAAGRVLYVGKAKDLRSRVGQYFSGHDTRAQLPFLLAEAARIETTVTDTELAALFLENTLIKEHLPPYNIRLRDDKNYAFIKIDSTTEIPQLGYARTITPGSHQKYFGPYSSAKKIRQTLDVVRRIFPYCSHTTVGNRPCFYYFLHRCPGVCVGKITLEEYRVQVNRISLFLAGQSGSVTKELRAAMTKAATAKQFERAARYRDALQALEVLTEKQLTILPKRVDWDVLAVSELGVLAAVTLTKIREGKVRDQENFLLERASGDNGPASYGPVLQSFCERYYSEASDIPRTIITATAVPNPGLLQTLLRSRVSWTPVFEVPSRGVKTELLSVAAGNGLEFLKKLERSQASNLDLARENMEQLQALLQLPTLPRRIEGYDISNIQGTNPVGSMVVCLDGLPAKAEYRKFKITVKDTPDDFAMMREMLTRRLSRVHPTSPDTEAWPAPDLLVIDGGKGQLSVAVSVLEELNLHIPVIGLAKRIEEIFQPHNSTPIVLPHSNTVLQLLQRLRDEAHRFGITFHRALRSKAATKSALDTIPGIGPKTKKLLKQKFGTVGSIRAASLDDIATVIGPAKATIVKKHLV
jgi:excinuclease ABC subunit C